MNRCQTGQNHKIRNAVSTSLCSNPATICEPPTVSLIGPRHSKIYQSSTKLLVGGYASHMQHPYYLMKGKKMNPNPIDPDLSQSLNLNPSMS